MRPHSSERIVMNKSSLILACTLAVIALGAQAQDHRMKYPAVYPFIPEPTQNIYNDVKRVSEDPNFIRNFSEMISQNLSKAVTAEKPWSASYWPLSKGTIADPYENGELGYFLDINWLTWE